MTSVQSVLKNFLTRPILVGTLAAGFATPSFAATATNPPGDPLAQCRLPEMGILHDVGLGFPRIPFRLKTVGDVHFTVIFVDFSDAPASKTPQDVMAIISPQAERYYEAVSYGKMHLVFDADFNWIRMGKASADYKFSRGASFETHRTYMQEAVDRAGPLGYSKADAILVLANPDVKAIDWGPAFAALPGHGIKAGGREFDNGATSGSDLSVLGWTWFNHEIGHTMSLVDLAGPLPRSGLWHTYVGDFSIMGNPTGAAPEYFGWERWQLGWLDDSQVVCANTPIDRVKLTPIERPGGTKIAIAPTGPSTAVVVESRRAEGFDKKLPKPGPLVYTIDTRLSTHDGAIRVQPVDDSDTHHLQAPLSPGQTIKVGKVSVELMSSDASGDTVRIINGVPRD